MEIIKHGKNYQKQICMDCGCEFSFHFNEIKIKYQEVVDYYSIYNYIDCPECNNKIILNEEQIEI